jgi:hypothetical protein
MNLDHAQASARLEGRTARLGQVAQRAANLAWFRVG